MRTLKILDLFCGAGGAAMGLHQGLDDLGIPHEIYGVDIVPQKHYPFEFLQYDVMRLPIQFLMMADFIWASPPCQAYSKTRAMHQAAYPKLIDVIRPLLNRTGKPYIIENVEGAVMDNFTVLCGSAFGLNVRRHRRFESNVMFLANGCRHDLQPEPLEICGTGAPTLKHRKPRTLAEARSAMGIPWMTRPELNEAIPPAYSRYIIKQIFGQVSLSQKGE